MSHVVLGECGKILLAYSPYALKKKLAAYSPKYAEIIKITQKYFLPFNNALRI
jgi:hypothetical protein